MEDVIGNRTLDSPIGDQKSSLALLKCPDWRVTIEACTVSDLSATVRWVPEADGFRYCTRRAGP